MIETINLNEVEPKVSKNKQTYLKVNRKYSVFEKDLIRFIEDNIGKTFNFEVVESNGFFNIRSLEEGMPQQSQTESRQGIEVKQAVKQEIKKEAFSEENEIIVRKEKQNSRTFGKGDDQIKLYFDTPEDLMQQINEHLALDLMPKTFLQERDLKNKE